MDYTNKVGEKVIHKMYGEGLIINADTYITVKFNEKTSTFPLTVFTEGYLIFLDQNLQNEVIEEINKIDELHRIKTEEILNEERILQNMKDAKKENIYIKNFITELVCSDKLSASNQVKLANIFNQEHRASIAFKLYSLAAERGSAQACLELGKYYYEGRHVKRDYKKAFELFIKGFKILEKDYDNLEQYYDYTYQELCEYLSKMYKNGSGVKKSIIEATKFYILTHNSGDDSFYWDTAIENRIFKLKVADYKTKIKQGDVNAKLELANYYLNRWYPSSEEKQLKHKEALEILNELVSINNLEAMYILGQHHYDLLANADYNLKKAFDLFSRAAEQGHLAANYYIGCYYRNGDIVEKNLEKAFEIFEKLAKQNNPYAIRAMADMYFKGEYVEKNVRKAYEILEKSITNNTEFYVIYDQLKQEIWNELCQLPITDNSTAEEIHYYAIRNSVDNKLELLKKAAEKGYTYSISEIASLYEKGEYVEKDIQKAIEYYAIYCSKEDGKRCGREYYKIATLYKTLNNYAKAIEFYNKSIEYSAWTNSPIELAEIYFEGIGVSKNIEKGLEILRENINKQEVNGLIKYII